MLIYDNKKFQNHVPFFLKPVVWFFLILIIWGTLITRNSFWSFWNPKLVNSAYSTSFNAQKNLHAPLGFFEDLFHFGSIRSEYYRLRTEEAIRLNSPSTTVVAQSKIYKTIEANSLISDLDGVSGVFIINKGSNDKIRIGMNVIIGDSVLVGKVIEVFSDHSKVESLYSPNISISVIDSSSNAIALVKRDNKGFLKLNLFTETSKFNMNDPLVSSLENKEYLRGLLVGKISNIVHSKTLAQPNIFVEPFFKLPYLDKVYVISTYP